MRSADDERRSALRWVWFGVLAVLVMLVAVVPSPYIVERPGPTVDVLGEVEFEDGDVAPVISVDGVDAAEGEGSLRLLTVSISGGPQHPKTWLSLLPALVDPSQRITPVEEVFPSGVTEEQRDEQNTVLMDNSQEQAAAAAFHALGDDVETTLSVAGVVDPGPSAGVLEEGDVLLEANGSAIADFTDLRARIVASGAGRPFELLVERDGKRVPVTVTPIVPDGGADPMLGATIASEYLLPRAVEFSVADIGGPSAGMIFALGVVDLMREGSLVDDLSVAGTGTIDARGVVGPIGGLEQKMWAASRAGSTLFLMPAGNCRDVPERIPADLSVVPVATLDEAIAAIETAAAGEAPPGLERCEAG